MYDAVSYITEFLIGGEEADIFKSRVGYTADLRKSGEYKVIIVPSSPICTTGTAGNGLFSLPLSEVGGIPLLFGTPETKWYNGTLVVHADIIASSFYLLSRYEEIEKRTVRDKHGRFPGKESLPFRAGFIHRPVVDEYGKLLRGWLRETGMEIEEPLPGIRKIWLTHDVDNPFHCRSVRNVIRETLKGHSPGKAWRGRKGPVEKDPFYTFPWLAEQAHSLQQAVGRQRIETIFFIKGGGGAKQDKPVYNLYSADLQALFTFAQEEQIEIGLHSSYRAGIRPELIPKEKETLQRASARKIGYNRHHFLSLREPEDYSWLEKAGITDDFTMGYPDIAGFRLGTCRPVRQIDPVTRRVSSLLLHPLTAMDVSLSEPAYMGFDYEEARAYCVQLIDATERFGGELVLLCHNDVVTAADIPTSSAKWHRKLYGILIDELKKR